MFLIRFSFLEIKYLRARDSLVFVNYKLSNINIIKRGIEKNKERRPRERSGSRKGEVQKMMGRRAEQIQRKKRIRSNIFKGCRNNRQFESGKRNLFSCS